MEITPEIFANRLRNMLKIKRPCEACPVQLGFAINTKRDVFGNEYAQYWREVDACRVCHKFMSIKGNCPCYELGHDEAIAAAHAALELWDKGEHPMQKEEKE